MSASPLQIERTIPLGALWTSFTLTMHGLLQWKRIVALLFLGLIPLLVVGIFRTIGIQKYADSLLLREYMSIEYFTVLLYYSSVAIPITVLLLAAGMIRDEQENQTLTYLLLCPIPRWAIYLSKLLAALLVAWLLVSLCMGTVLFCLWTASGVSTPVHWVNRWLMLLPATGLLIAANGGIFALLSVLLRPSLILGVIYIAIFEVFLANYEFILRKFTSVHYFQCIVCNWMGDQFMFVSVQAAKTSLMKWPWHIAEEIRPPTQDCVITLLSIFLVSTLLAMYFFTKKEYRMKTPEGS